jgi:signal peptidase II
MFKSILSGHSFQKKITFLICISFFVIGIDQLTKTFVHTQMQLHESKIIIENFFNFTYVRNFGAAFGFLAQTPELFRDIFFLSMPPLACGLILYILVTLKETQTAQIAALSLIFGGALGNYIDRLHYRYVVDFLDFHFKNKYSWPAFNVADMSIVSGVCLLVFMILTEKNVSAD